MRAAAERDRRVRLEGGGNVLAAARAAGTRRYVVQSTGFFYAPGPGLAVEGDALAGVEAVALRYGFFYGPGTWFTDEGDIAEQVRARKYPLAGAGSGVWSWVHIADAAAATLAALECDRRRRAAAPERGRRARTLGTRFRRLRDPLARRFERPSQTADRFRAAAPGMARAPWFPAR